MPERAQEHEGEQPDLDAAPHDDPPPSRPREQLDQRAVRPAAAGIRRVGVATGVRRVVGGGSSSRRAPRALASASATSSTLDSVHNGKRAEQGAELVDRVARRGADRRGRGRPAQRDDVLQGRRQEPALAHRRELDLHLEDDVGEVALDGVGRVDRERVAGRRRPDPGTSESPVSESLRSTGSRWRSSAIRSSLVSLTTRVPTLAELVQLGQHADELRVLVAQHGDRGAGGIQRVPDRLLLGDEGPGQPVERLHRLHDVALLGVRACSRGC